MVSERSNIHCSSISLSMVIRIKANVERMSLVIGSLFVFRSTSDTTPYELNSVLNSSSRTSSGKLPTNNLTEFVLMLVNCICISHLNTLDFLYHFSEYLSLALMKSILYLIIYTSTKFSFFFLPLF